MLIQLLSLLLLTETCFQSLIRISSPLITVSTQDTVGIHGSSVLNGSQIDLQSFPRPIVELDQEIKWMQSLRFPDSDTPACTLMKQLPGHKFFGICQRNYAFFARINPTNNNEQENTKTLKLNVNSCSSIEALGTRAFALCEQKTGGSYFLYVLNLEESGKLEIITSIDIKVADPWGRLQLRICSHSLYVQRFVVYQKGGDKLLSNNLIRDIVLGEYNIIRKELAILASKKVLGSLLYGIDHGSLLNSTYFLGVDLSNNNIIGCTLLYAVRIMGFDIKCNTNSPVIQHKPKQFLNIDASYDLINRETRFVVSDSESMFICFGFSLADRLLNNCHHIHLDFEVSTSKRIHSGEIFLGDHDTMVSIVYHNRFGGSELILLVDILAKRATAYELHDSYDSQVISANSNSFVLLESASINNIYNMFEKTFTIRAPHLEEKSHFEFSIGKYTEGGNFHMIRSNISFIPDPDQDIFADDIIPDFIYAGDSEINLGLNRNQMRGNFLKIEAESNDLQIKVHSASTLGIDIVLRNVKIKYVQFTENLLIILYEDNHISSYFYTQDNGNLLGTDSKIVRFILYREFPHLITEETYTKLSSFTIGALELSIIDYRTNQSETGLKLLYATNARNSMDFSYIAKEKQVFGINGKYTLAKLAIASNVDPETVKIEILSMDFKKPQTERTSDKKYVFNSQEYGIRYFKAGHLFMDNYNSLYIMNEHPRDMSLLRISFAYIDRGLPFGVRREIKFDSDESQIKIQYCSTSFTLVLFEKNILDPSKSRVYAKNKDVPMTSYLEVPLGPGKKFPVSLNCDRRQEYFQIQAYNIETSKYLLLTYYSFDGTLASGKGHSEVETGDAEHYIISCPIRNLRTYGFITLKLSAPLLIINPEGFHVILAGPIITVKAPASAIARRSNISIKISNYKSSINKTFEIEVKQRKRLSVIPKEIPSLPIHLEATEYDSDRFFTLIGALIHAEIDPMQKTQELS